MMDASSDTVRVSPDGNSWTVRVPLSMRRRGGRKVVISPGGQHPSHEQRTQWNGVDASLALTLAQAFHWQQLLDEGQYATIGDLANARKLDRSFVARTVKLTLLAPDIVEAILDGRQSPAIQRQNLLHGLPLDWHLQRL